MASPSTAKISVQTSEEGGTEDSPLSAKLHLIPNIEDTSDTESVVDNTKVTLRDNVSLNKSLGAMNNLNKDSNIEEDDRFLIPDMPDLFFPSKPEASKSFASASKLSDSMSSLASIESEVGSNPSGDVTSTDFGSSRTGVRRKKKKTLKPRIKNKFGDATIQYIQERLEGKLFSGWLEERQRLDSVVSFSSKSITEEDQLLSGWRDVIEVDGCETDMVRQLGAVMSSVPGAKEGKKWINIKAPTLVHGYMLWLLLPEPHPPGHYWFRVTKVTRHPLFGLHVELSVIRAVGESDAESATARAKRIAAATATLEGDLPKSLGLAWERVWDSVKESCSSKVFKHWITTLLLPANIGYGIRMVVLTIVSIIIGIIHVSREICRLFLSFMRESGTLIDRATPLAQTIIAFFEKIIGGFFLLLAMVYKDFRRPPPPPNVPGLGPPPPHMAIMSGPPPPGPPNYGSSRRFVSANAWSYNGGGN